MNFLKNEMRRSVSPVFLPKLILLYILFVAGGMANAIAQPVCQRVGDGQAFALEPIEFSAQLSDFRYGGLDYREARCWLEVTREDEHDDEVNSSLRRSRVKARSIRKIPAYYDAKRKSWRLFFVPRVAGKYQFRLFSHVEGLAETGNELNIQVNQAKTDGSKQQAQGFVKVQGQYFTFDTGDLYYPIGQNIGWALGESPMQGFEHYLDRMALHGENFMRLWLCSWGVFLDTAEPGRLNLAQADDLEKILQMCESRGIYVMLCLTNHHDIAEKKSATFYWSQGERYGVKTTADFLTSRWAQDKFKQRLYYLVARYGHYRSLMSWELFNEINYVRAGREKINAWVSTMQTFIQSHDVHDRPVCVSFGPSGGAEQKHNRDHGAIIGFHFYLKNHHLGDDVPGHFLRLRRQFSRQKKPFFLAEFGYPEGVESEAHKKDKDGLALHNGLWSSLMSKHAGAPANWWWDSYIEPYGLYYHYQALSKFVAKTKAVIMPGKSFERTTRRGLGVLGLKTTDQVILWAYNKSYNWRFVLEGKHKGTACVAQRINLHKMKPGKYDVFWFDTRKGSWSAPIRLKSQGPTLVLDVPKIARDLACHLVRVDGRAGAVAGEKGGGK